MLQHYYSVTVAILPFLWSGFVQTFWISLVAIVAGSVLGFLIGIVRSQRVPVLHPLFGLYIHILRGTPFLVQLYVFYFVLPNTGIEALQWSSDMAAFVSLSVYTSSYVAEIVMAAIDGIPAGQWEASASLGL